MADNIAAGLSLTNECKTSAIAFAAESNRLQMLIITCDCLTISILIEDVTPEFWSSICADSGESGKPLSRLQFETEPLRVGDNKI